MKSVCSSLLFLASSFGLCYAQGTKDDVHLIQNLFFDSAKAPKTYINGGLDYASFDFLNRFTAGGSVHAPVSPLLEVGAGLNYLNLNPEVGDSRSGLSDLFVSGKYHLDFEQAQLAAGGFVTFPLGSDEVGGGSFDFGGFGAGRLGLLESTVLTGMVGLFSFDVGSSQNSSGNVVSDRDFVLQLAPGIIHQLNDKTHLIGELTIQTNTSFMQLSVGGDLETSSKGRFRPAIALGLDNAAPDISLTASYLVSF